MKLFVPTCGDRIVLAEPWTFLLHLERRNMKFAETSGLFKPNKDQSDFGAWDGKAFSGVYKKVEAIFPAGTTLECDRVYIRTFNKSAVGVENDFDSITWRVMKKDRPERHKRFWAKLSDCNRIEFTLEVDSLFRDRVKKVRKVLES